MENDGLNSAARQSTEIEAEASPASAQDVIKPLDETTVEFDFWQDLKDSMPPWINEVVGFALIVFGILSFISLYIASDALVAVTWADMLKALFGNGAILVAGALFVMGLALWLPGFGASLRFSSARMLALEIIFLSLLAMLHLADSDSELRALARAGQGGGLIGWGLSYPFFWIIGRLPALALFSALIACCAVVAVGLRPRHLIATLKGLGGRLRRFSERLATTPATAADDESRAIYRQLAGISAYRAQIMRIRPSVENLPESLRASRKSAKPSERSLSRIRANRAARANRPATPSDDAAKGELAAEEANPALAVGGGEDAVLIVEADPSDDATRQPPADEARKWREHLPSIDCLTDSALTLPDESEVKRKAMLIQNTLREFDLETTVIEVQVGPILTRYALQPHKEDGSDRIRMSRIASYKRDLSLALAAKRLRLETPVPGTNYMGIEVPNKEPSLVALRNVLESAQYKETAASERSPLRIPLGRDVAGAPVSLDLAETPHLLIAGATGSGKSICMAAIATALLMQCPPSELRLVMLDPKMVELSRFEGVPHLLGPVELRHERIIGVLRWCAREMDRRYKLLEESGARDIASYNGARADEGSSPRLPYLVILIDEIGDLMLSHPDETEGALTRLAQMARAVGMHMIVATQRPSVDVITGLIKANFPSRIAFAVASAADSRVIIDRAGAEQLLGRGDMLLLSADAPAPRRVQGCFVSEDDVRVVVEHWRAKAEQLTGAGAKPANAPPWEASLERRRFATETDPMLEDVLRLIVNSGEASASLIQRRLGLGYPRAARIMDLLQEFGAVGDELGGGRSRKVIIPPGVDPLDHLYENYAKAKRQVD